MKQISRLHFITTNADTAEKACRGGIDWIQLRLKNVSYEEYKAEALKVQAVCKRYSATFIINDNVQLAVDIGADGVHIGKQDMHVHEARAILGEECIIGATANTYRDIVVLSANHVNYIGLGPFRFTETKQNLSPILGEHGYTHILELLKKDNVTPPPLIAIGGIQHTDISTLMHTGIHGIAVSGAIANAGDVTLEAKTFKDNILSVVKDPATM